MIDGVWGATALYILASAHIGAADRPIVEYSYEKACEDWTNISNRLTALGAKHSSFHAGVYSDGSIALAGPGWCRADKWLLKYRPERLLVSFGFGDPPDFNRNPQEQWLLDGYLPVLVTRVTPSSHETGDACAYQESSLVHLLGTDEARTGREPLILRVRIEAHNPKDEAVQAVVWLQLNAFDHKSGVDPNSDMLAFGSRNPKRILYEGGPLRLQGSRVVTANGEIRALVSAPPDSKLSFHQKDSLREDTPAWKALRKQELLENLVRVDFPVAALGSATIHLTIPVFSLGDEQADALLADDFDAAWSRTLAFWEKEVARTTRFAVPEPVVMNVIRSYPWQVMTKMDLEPDTGVIIPKVNALLYEAVWGHITAWECNVLDYLGYKEESERYMQPFLDWQGLPKTVGKSKGISDWSGFLGANARYTYWNWAAHHGYVMWQLGEHYLLTGDETWFRERLPKLLRAADWTIARIDGTKQTDEAGRKVLSWGLFPGSISTDLVQHLDNSAFNDAWIYRGLATLGEALRVAGHPRAMEIQERAHTYRADIRIAWRRAIARYPLQTLEDGSLSPYVPGLLHLRDWRDAYGKDMGSGFLQFYHMDTGPLHFGQCGVFGNGDEEMEWALGLISRGPQEVRFLKHGVSTCEIVFAPQFDYYLAIDDPVRAVEVFYSSLAGGMDRRTLSGWEFRGGVQFMPVSIGEMVRQLRLMLIHERPDDELRIAQATPRAWLRQGKVIEVSEAPTRFGDISFRIRSEVDQGRILVELDPPERRAPRRLRLKLRHPESLPIQSVQINGKEHTDFTGEWIEMPLGVKKVESIVRY